MHSLRRWVLVGILIGLSAAGASISVPGILGTPALDSLPAFFAGFVVGAGPGALVGALGHLFTAALHGFPLTLPVHVTIAAEMAVVVAVAAPVRQRFGWLAGLLWSVLANGILAPAAFIVWPGFGLSFFIGALPQLLVATVLNAGLAALVGQAVIRIAPVRVFLGQRG